MKSVKRKTCPAVAWRVVIHSAISKLGFADVFWSKAYH